MKLVTILLLLTLSGIVRSWVANVTPFLLSIGTVLMAFDPNIDLQTFELPIKKTSDNNEDSKQKEIKSKKKPKPLTPY